jgi:hypothetical protein
VVVVVVVMVMAAAVALEDRMVRAYVPAYVLSFWVEFCYWVVKSVLVGHFK